MALRVERLTCGYGGAPVLREVSLEVGSGQVLGLLGRNGAGKTTLLRAILGLLRPVEGSVRIDGIELTRLEPHRIPWLGIGYVPQGRRLFPALTVEENLRIGLRLGRRAETLSWVLDLFPALRNRLHYRAGSLSGGEQQMVAIARALCARPSYLLLDEPLEGLAPPLARTVLRTLSSLAAGGVGVLLVEQRVEATLEVASGLLVLDGGQIRFAGTPEEVRRDPAPLVRALGVRRS